MPSVIATTLVEVEVGACLCTPAMHRLLLKALHAPEHTIWDCDPGVRSSKRERNLLDAQGLAELYVDPLWSRGQWRLTLYPAGIVHAEDLSGSHDLHVGTDGCGAAWDASGRCTGCGAWRLLTDRLAVARLALIRDQEERERELWASGLACPRHGRGTSRLVRTDKTCAICHEGMLRLVPLDVPISNAEQVAPQPPCHTPFVVFSTIYESNGGPDATEHRKHPHPGHQPRG